MPLYECKNCNYSTKRLTEYNRHLKTKKHTKNIGFQKEMPPEIKKHIKTSKNIQSTSKNIQKHPIMCEKAHLECDFCGKSFTLFTNKRRHELHRCKLNTQAIIKNQENQIKKLEKQIELLLTKVGNNYTTTTINNNNNIQLNNYGSEDLSHISNELKTQLLKIPYGAIPKLIEKIHFNENKPENTNIMIKNKRDNKISIFEGGKWVYKNKKHTIQNIIDDKYYILEDHYMDEGSISLNSFQSKNYKDFSNNYHNDLENIKTKIIEDTENTILNHK